jgi:hypothetical protein
MAPMNPRLLRPTASGASHPEARDWAARVTTNGGTVSATTLRAVDTFCRAIDAAGIRGKFYRLSLLCGNDLLAALVPLYRSTTLGGTVLGLATDENVGFVSGDYSLTGSFDVGPSAGKYLRCNERPISTMFPAGNDRQAGHLAAAFTGLASTLVDTFLGVKTGGSGENYNLEGRVGVARGQNWGTRAANWTAGSAGRQLVIMTRNSGVHTVYDDGVSVVSSTGSSTTNDTDARFGVYGTGAPAGGDGMSLSFLGRIYAYSLGDGLDATQAAAYNTALKTFLNTTGRTA